MIRIGTVLGGWSAVLSAVLILGSPHGLLAEDIVRSASPNTLLEMAYAAEVSGQTAVRAALLDQVLDRDPENERARWFAGHVRNGEVWGPVTAVEQDRTKDGLLQEYVQRRETCGEDSASRLRLANWCRDHAMPDRHMVCSTLLELTIQVLGLDYLRPRQLGAH